LSLIFGLKLRTYEEQAQVNNFDKIKVNVEKWEKEGGQKK